MNMLLIGGIGGWLVAALTTIFLSIIDGIAFWLLSISYNIFYAVAQLDIFGGSNAGATLYNDITRRVYMILSIVMVFVFAYQLIMLVIDPEGKAKDAASHIVRDTLISIILIIILPLLYRYMAIFQYHVLENNTIPAIIMGTNPSSGDNKPGKSISMMIMLSFYHPEGTTYNTFFDENGKVSDNAIDDCKSESYAEKSDEICELYVEELHNWENASSGNGLKPLVWNWTLKEFIWDGMDYTIILSTIAAICAIWLFLSYALDLGVRAVKLGVLQLISPIPVILRIFPQTKKSFDKWFFQMKKTYIELFARVAVIFFALEIIKLVPRFVEIIFDSNNNIDAGAFTKCVATVILILGILRFCQDAPKLFKEIFDTGGGLFSGLNFKPGIKSRYDESVTNNKMLIGAANRVVPALSGGVGQFMKAYQENKDALGTAYSNNPLSAAAHALPSALRGLATGAHNKGNMNEFTLSSLKNTSAESGRHVEEVMGSNERIRKLREARAQYLKDKNDTAHPAVQDAALINYLNSFRTIHAEEAETWWKTKNENFEDYIKTLSGVNANVSLDTESLSRMSEAIKDVFDGAGIAKLNEQIKEADIKLKNTAEHNPDGSRSDEYVKREKYLNDLKAKRDNQFITSLSSVHGQEMLKSFKTQLEDELKNNRSLCPGDVTQIKQMIAELDAGHFNAATIKAMADSKSSIDSVARILKTNQKFVTAQANARNKAQKAQNPPTSNNSGGSGGTK